MNILPEKKRAMPREVGLEDMAHVVESNLIKKLDLSHQETELIEACLLGDGAIVRSGKHYRLRIEHSLAQKDYVDWKYEALRRLCISSPQYVPTHQSFRFGTVGHPEITTLRHAWYTESKLIPEKFRLNPRSLAIWFMDDGTRHARTVDISVYGFSTNDIDRMRSQMAALGITSTMNGDSRGYRIYIVQKSYPVFKKLVNPYIVKCMAYKLP